jgi:transposase
MPALMDRAYEDGRGRPDAAGGVWWLRYKAAAPPKRSRAHPWDYDKELYKRRNEVERFFRRIKGCRRVCARHDKLDIMFTAFIYVALMVITVRSVNTH